MRKYVSVFVLLMVITGVAVVIGMARAAPRSNANSGTAGSTVGAAQKYVPTFPSYTTTNKTMIPQTPITSCPGSLPTPQVINIALGHGDPTYYFVNEAIVVSNGKGWYVMSGNLLSNPNQGVIVLDPISTDPCKDDLNYQHGTPYPTMPVFLMPSLHGAVTITAVSSTGTTVSFKAADGTTGHFDYAAQTFAP